MMMQIETTADGVTQPAFQLGASVTHVPTGLRCGI